MHKKRVEATRPTPTARGAALGISLNVMQGRLHAMPSVGNRLALIRLNVAGCEAENVGRLEQGTDIAEARLSSSLAPGIDRRCAHAGSVERAVALVRRVHVGVDVDIDEDQTEPTRLRIAPATVPSSIVRSRRPAPAHHLLAEKAAATLSATACAVALTASRFIALGRR